MDLGFNQNVFLFNFWILFVHQSYLWQSNWDSGSDDDNTEREEISTVVRVDKKVDALMADCVTVINVAFSYVGLFVCLPVCMSIDVFVPLLTYFSVLFLQLDFVHCGKYLITSNCF